ncbi:sodium:solute symporter [Spirochaetia bacterium]|nr:sodium:solute symporter [Spirochaetia bacterium]
MPLLVLTFTIAATHFGGGALVGGVQQGAEMGLWAGMYAILGYAAACLVNAFVAPHFRRRSNNLTPPDFIESRYGASKILRGYHAFVYIFGTIAIIAAQFSAFGGMAQAFGIARPVAILIGVVVVILYTCMAGMWGVAVTDVMQLGICLIFLPIIAVLSMNVLTKEVGVQASQVFAQPFFATPDAAGTFMYSLIPTIVGSMFAYEYYLRFQSAKDEKDARNSSLIACVVLIILAIPVGLIGDVAHRVFPHVPSGAVLGEVVNKTMPKWAGVIFLAAVLAAIMSTADSMMTSLSGMCSRDIYHKIMHPDKDYDELPKSMAVTRWSAIIGALLAAVIALNFTSIIGLLFWTSPLQSGVLFAPMILGLFWKGANRYGAFASIICGGVTALIDMIGLVHLPERMLVTMAVGTIALIIGSIVGKNKPGARTELAANL